MRRVVSAGLMWIIAVACRPDYTADKCFSADQQAAIINQCVRYATKLAPTATHETKFSAEFDWYYNLATTEFDFRACSPIANGEYFFLMTRKARSIWPAREAIGGKLKIDQNNKLIDYEEEFRMWKMAEDSLNTRAFELFNLMVKGDDLTPYRSKFQGDRYIELPDDRWFYDKKSKRWRDGYLDSTRLTP